MISARVAVLRKLRLLAGMAIVISAMPLLASRPYVVGNDVAERDRDEPDSHHQSDDSRGGELRHCTQADGTQRQLSDLDNEVRHDEPRGADENLGAALCDHRRRHEDEKRKSREQ